MHAKRPQVFSTSPAWSPDGQWIAFVTRDPSMVEGGVGGAPGASNVYARLITDLGSSAKLVSNKATDLATAGNGDSDAPMFAPGSDNTILYTTMATDIVGGSVGVMKLVAEPLGGGALVRVDRTTAGTGGANGVISQAVWSPDGTKVAFISTADNLAPNDTNGAGDVFVSVPGTSLQRISQASASVGANGLSRSVQWSGDSTKLAFETSASNLTSDTSSLRKVVRADAAGGGLVLVSTLTGGTVPADADAFSPSINADGTLISFRTRATNLTFSLIDQVYVKNLTTQATTRISQSAGGEFGNAFSGGGDVNNFSPTSNQYLLRSDATILTAEGVSGAFVWTP